VKNSEQTVAQYVEETAKSLGKDIQVVSMVRYEVGEGIEKKEECFLEEVMKQMGN
jgi:elongation factor Ts